MLFRDLKKILLVQLGDIGDLVWMTPALWAVKGACPQAEVSLLVREGNGALLKADPSVGRIFEIRKYRGGLYKRFKEQLLFLRDFRREHFDMVIDLRADERGAVMARLSGAPVRVAQYYKDVPFWRNHCFNRLVRPARRAETELGAAEQSLCIVRELGVEVQTGIPRLWVRESVQEDVRALLVTEGIDDRNWCSLNPFARWSYKELPNDKWAEIINWLWDEFRLITVIVGSAGERKKSTRLMENCKGKVYNLAGKTDLEELAGLLSLSRLHIGVDSAAPHIAAAVGTPTVTVYGPSDWRDWAPPGKQHNVIVAEGDCVPCYRKGCDNSGISKCLETIPTDKIKKTLSETLKQQNKSI